MNYVSMGSVDTDLPDAEIDSLFSDALARALAETGTGSHDGDVLILPPDGTRFHSKAGFITDIAARELGFAGREGRHGRRLGAVMPALGTHVPMSAEEIRRMFPLTPVSLFRPHNWRTDVVELGRLDADFVGKATGGAVRYDWPVQVNRALRDGGYSLLISIGQVVPHEVIGMANHLKNLFVGTGGKEAIDKSHFAGAAYGMERMMGRADTPVRELFDEGYRRFGGLLPPVLWALTVVGRRSDGEAERGGHPRGSLAVRGLFVGFGRECFERAAELAREVSVDLLDEPIRKAVVYLESDEYKSTWLGNKAVYRLRMAMADGGELLVLAPGLERFGEDPAIDALIRKHGYRPAAAIRAKVEADAELADALSAAAHLIHGSSEGRFTVRYCPGPRVSRAEIESVGYEWGDLEANLRRYDIGKLDAGWNDMADGERVFFVPNPALGLWAERKRFEGTE
ncbi:MAG TPA: D-mannonate epimerase [Treponema sp.]|nr:D-mannonate epimerase [Treponema sp.]